MDQIFIKLVWKLKKNYPPIKINKLKKIKVNAKELMLSGKKNHKIDYNYNK